MKYIEAPTEFAGRGTSLFLAGGISDSEAWQTRMATLLAGTDLVVLNPRRKQFGDGEEAEIEQIEWEHRHLKRATAVLFWFPPQTLCPIALLELGTRLVGTQPLFIGVHPQYRRRLDVRAQTRLARPEVEIVDSLEALADQVVAWTERLVPVREVE
jgi:hypothetical protein